MIEILNTIAAVIGYLVVALVVAAFVLVKVAKYLGVKEGEAYINELYEQRDSESDTES